MIKLYSVKEKQKKQAEQASRGGGGTTQSPGELRAQKDLSQLDLPKGGMIRFPGGKDRVMDFEFVLVPDEGMYREGTFLFSFHIPQTYPHDPPKVKCLTKVFHPNIDLDGNICLNILREDWSPVLSVSSIIYGLHFLFLAPNPEDPLNKEASAMMERNPSQFSSSVRLALTRGCTILGTYFPPARGTSTSLIYRFVKMADGQPRKRSFRKYSYRGVDLEQLLDMSNDELVELYGARQRRRFQRGLNRKCMALIKKLRKARKAVEGTGEKPEPVRTHLRNMVIIPEMIGSIIGVYNGKTFNQVEIKPDMLGDYLAEYSITYKPVRHGRPGIGASTSSRFIPLK